jgi:hypothetical protein
MLPFSKERWLRTTRLDVGLEDGRGDVVRLKGRGRTGVTNKSSEGGARQRTRRRSARGRGRRARERRMGILQLFLKDTILCRPVCCLGPRGAAAVLGRKWVAEQLAEEKANRGFRSASAKGLRDLRRVRKERTHSSRQGKREQGRDCFLDGKTTRRRGKEGERGGSWRLKGTERVRDDRTCSDVWLLQPDLPHVQAWGETFRWFDGAHPPTGHSSSSCAAQVLSIPFRGCTNGTLA